MDDNPISVTCKHERFKGNVCSQSVDCVKNHLRVTVTLASASLASVNLAG